MKKSHVVNILSHQLTVLSDSDEAYVKEVAKFVSQKLEAVMSRSKSASSVTGALLVCMNIADELFQSKKSQDVKVSTAVRRLDQLLLAIDQKLDETETPSLIDAALS